QPPFTRLRTLRADDPVSRGPPVPRRLRVEEGRRFPVGAQPLLLILREARRRVALEGVDAGALGGPCRERVLSGGTHPALLRQLLHLCDVDRAPDARRAARREADRVRRRAQAAAHAVDPAEAERLVYGLGPGDAGLAGFPLVKTDEELRRGFV